ncbi:MAG: rRNA pseudouridine synthase [Zetaproteobacteria bacterium]|nr:MAG: rRNA pseudouridine synthase [Zetaproteobacteria bacterium]
MNKHKRECASMRINRFLAQCGLCSRREADRWILAGRVRVNGEIVRQPGLIVGTQDEVVVDGKPARPIQRHSYFLYNKPRGLLCSRKDARGRPLIYDQLDVPPNVQSIGRLDMDTEGLLLLTNDGELHRRLTDPHLRLAREYRARVAGHLSLETLATLRRGGLDIGQGEQSDAWDVIVDAESASHSWLTIIVRRGRWREVRRTLAAAGHPVRRLIRTRFGPIRLDQDMPQGSWRSLSKAEVRKLKRYHP